MTEAEMKAGRVMQGPRDLSGFPGTAPWAHFTPRPVAPAGEGQRVASAGAWLGPRLQEDEARLWDSPWSPEALASVAQAWGGRIICVPRPRNTQGGGWSHTDFLSLALQNGFGKRVLMPGDPSCLPWIGGAQSPLML